MQQTCTNQWCAQSFEITDADLSFYEKVSPVFNGKKELIPPPTQCPECRSQKRHAMTNVRQLHKRKCDATGKEIVSIFSDDKPMPVYDVSYWWGDDWNPLTYGIEWDPSQAFLKQLHALLLSVPTMALIVDGLENSDYTNYCGWAKNCYLCFCTDHSEDCLYDQDVLHSRNTVDCFFCQYMELCYECIDCLHCFNLQHSQQCQNCNDSQYLFDCMECNNCFCCTGLRHKEYCILNKQCKSKEEYETKVSELMPNVKKHFDTLKIKHPRKVYVGTQNENVNGNYLYHCNNVTSCFDDYDLEDSKYCTTVKGGGHHCYDMERWGHPAEYCYECCGTGEGATNVCFSYYTWNGVSNLFYCGTCISCENCFGCIGLRKKKYSILNKQYSKEEYETLVPKIIAKMRVDGEWGEFFPVEMSPFAYNETVAQEYFPLTKKEVEARGWKWRDEKDEIPQVKNIIPASKLPDSITDIPDDVSNWAIECEETKRPFRIVKQELEFYRKMKLPIPHFHPDERHKQRMALRNPRKLWKRDCMKCGKEIETTYAPERLEIVYCEECYLKEVY